MRKSYSVIAASLLVSTLFAGAAQASTTVVGNGLAAQCSKEARFAAANAFADPKSIDFSTAAMESEVLSTHELAATRTNRGILYLVLRDLPAANRDFDVALRMEPGLGEAYVNRGAAYVFQGRLKEGLAEIDRGLALNPEEPEKAYFNRGLAHEYLVDLKGAYYDYLKASALRPEWDTPRNELVRFTVSKR